jgi:hypothetical protein
MQLGMLYFSERATAEQNERLIKEWKRLADSMQQSIHQNESAIESAAVANRDNIAASNAQNQRLVGNSMAQSKAALDASITQYANELRPYVYVSMFTLLGTPEIGKQITGRGYVTNSGRTPAVHARACADVILLGRGQILDDNFPCPGPHSQTPSGINIQSEIVIGPNNPPVPVDSPGTTIEKLTITGAPPEIANKTFAELLSDDSLRVYFYGDITYREMLRPANIHHTQFCGQYSPTQQFTSCEHHNNAD